MGEYGRKISAAIYTAARVCEEHRRQEFTSQAFSKFLKSSPLGRGGAGSSIILLYGDMLNERVALFLITILRNVCKKYNYSNMCFQDKLRAKKIMLPVDKSGNPDWNFMEQFVKDMPIYNLIGK
ncbi:MAG: hypothetical protein IKD10_13645 [Lentisphaeria bacterium]|nr:hypothetical protein [Lentisphaeria bacterium]